MKMRVWLIGALGFAFTFVLSAGSMLTSAQAHCNDRHPQHCDALVSYGALYTSEGVTLGGEDSNFPAQIEEANSGEFSDLFAAPSITLTLPDSFLDFFGDDAGICFGGNAVQVSSIFYRIYSDGTSQTNVTFPGNAITKEGDPGESVNYILTFNGYCVEGCQLLPLDSDSVNQTSHFQLFHSEVGTRLKRGGRGCTCVGDGCFNEEDTNVFTNVFEMDLTLEQLGS